MSVSSSVCKGIGDKVIFPFITLRLETASTADSTVKYTPIYQKQKIITYLLPLKLGVVSLPPKIKAKENFQLNQIQQKCSPFQRCFGAINFIKECLSKFAYYNNT